VGGTTTEEGKVPPSISKKRGSGVAKLRRWGGLERFFPSWEGEGQFFAFLLGHGAAVSKREMKIAIAPCTSERKKRTE